MSLPRSDEQRESADKRKAEMSCVPARTALPASAASKDVPPVGGAGFGGAGALGAAEQVGPLQPQGVCEEPASSPIGRWDGTGPSYVVPRWMTMSSPQPADAGFASDKQAPTDASAPIRKTLRIRAPALCISRFERPGWSSRRNRCAVKVHNTARGTVRQPPVAVNKNKANVRWICSIQRIQRASSVAGLTGDRCETADPRSPGARLPCPPGRTP